MRWINLTAYVEMRKVFAKKAVVLKRSCDEAKKEIEVLEQTLWGLEAKKAQL